MSRQLEEGHIIGDRRERPEHASKHTLAITVCLGIEHAYMMAKTRRPKRSGDGSPRRVRRSSEMRNRLMGMRILLTVALASSAVAFAQNGQRKPFNPHDLSGFWDITNTGLPRGA